MRAVVVYESMYGNTRVVAEAIASGLRTAADVRVVPVGDVRDGDVMDADLLVVGGPTHVHGMSRPSTREAAAKAAEKPDSGLTFEPQTSGAGLREWLAGDGALRVAVAAFDTRMPGPAWVTGRASRAIVRLLRARGGRLLPGGQASFLVSKRNQLRPGELARAEAWGSALSAQLVGPIPSRI